MHLKINEAPPIKKIVFTCDQPLHQKMEQYPLTRDFLNQFNTTALIGVQGSGKSSLMVNFMLTFYKKVFEFVYVFIPETSRNSLKTDIFKKYLPKEQLFEELNEETINDLYEKLKINSSKNHKSIVIYDDVQKSLKNTRVLKSLKNIICNQRHLKVVNLILLQNWYALDRSLREVINNIILFKLGKSQTNKIFEEIIETYKDKFDDIRRLVYDEPHQWLFVNVKTQRMFKCFNEIICDEEDDSDLEYEK